jgi:hypothetical protein
VEAKLAAAERDLRIARRIEAKAKLEVEKIEAFLKMFRVY